MEVRFHVWIRGGRVSSGPCLKGARWGMAERRGGQIFCVPSWDFERMTAKIRGGWGGVKTVERGRKRGRINAHITCNQGDWPRTLKSVAGNLGRGFKERGK